MAGPRTTTSAKVGRQSIGQIAADRLPLPRHGHGLSTLMQFYHFYTIPKRKKGMISGRSRWPFRPGTVYGRKFIRRCQPAKVLKRRHPGERFQIGRPARAGLIIKRGEVTVGRCASG